MKYKKSYTLRHYNIELMLQELKYLRTFFPNGELNIDYDNIELNYRFVSDMQTHETDMINWFINQVCNCNYEIIDKEILRIKKVKRYSRVIPLLNKIFHWSINE